MATNLRPVPPPFHADFLDKTGKVSKPWQDFIEATYRYQQAISAAKVDGTYTLGLGTTAGQITLTQGIITAVQEVVA